MILNLKLVKVDSKYCDYLRKFDNKVAYNMNTKELRPFVGILFTIESCEYFAPLSSPKPKHITMKNTMDFYKIDNGELGAVNFNNMIPVMKNNYKVISLRKISYNKQEIKYNELLKDQLSWLNEHYDQVKNKSFKLYNLYNENKLPKSIKDRCCNFKLLENKCIEYNKNVKSSAKQLEKS